MSNTSPSCPNAHKHLALAALLGRVLESFGFQDVPTMLRDMIGTDAFLRPWAAYRDSYLLDPKFKLEGLRPGGEDMSTLFGHITREVNGRSSRRTNQRGEDAGGRSHTVQLFSSLIHKLTEPGAFYHGGKKEDLGWLAGACRDLFLLVKLLREEYARGHGDLMDAIEERYPSRWFSEERGEVEEDKEPKRYQESIPESDISEYRQLESDRSSTLSLIDRNSGPVSQPDYDDPDIYYRGFTDYESSEETDEDEEDGEFFNEKMSTAATAAHTERLSEEPIEQPAAVIGVLEGRKPKNDSQTQLLATVSRATLDRSYPPEKAIAGIGTGSYEAHHSELAAEGYDEPDRLSPANCPRSMEKGDSYANIAKHSQMSPRPQEIPGAGDLARMQNNLSMTESSIAFFDLVQPPANSLSETVATAPITDPPTSQTCLTPRHASIVPPNVAPSKPQGFRMPFLLSDSESEGENGHDLNPSVQQHEQRTTREPAIGTREDEPNSPTEPPLSSAAPPFSFQHQPSGTVPQIDDDSLFLPSTDNQLPKPSHSPHAALLNSVPRDPPHPAIPKRSATELGLFLELSERRAPPMLSFFDPEAPASSLPAEDPFVEEWAYFGNQ